MLLFLRNKITISSAANLLQHHSQWDPGLCLNMKEKLDASIASVKGKDSD